MEDQRKRDASRGESKKSRAFRPFWPTGWAKLRKSVANWREIAKKRQAKRFGEFI
jgi:hypothetical protein